MNDLNIQKQNEFKKFPRKKAISRQSSSTPVRSPAYYSDLQAALKYAKKRCKKRFSLARKRVALLILYLTGMRVSSLLLMNIKDLKSLNNFADTGQGACTLLKKTATSKRNDHTPTHGTKISGFTTR